MGLATTNESSDDTNGWFSCAERQFLEAHAGIRAVGEDAQVRVQILLYILATAFDFRPRDLSIPIAVERQRSVQLQ
jgi:hypothetical protein